MHARTADHNFRTDEIWDGSKLIFFFFLFNSLWLHLFYYLRLNERNHWQCKQEDLRPHSLQQRQQKKYFFFNFSSLHCSIGVSETDFVVIQWSTVDAIFFPTSDAISNVRFQQMDVVSPWDNDAMATRKQNESHSSLLHHYRSTLNRLIKNLCTNSNQAIDRFRCGASRAYDAHWILNSNGLWPVRYGPHFFFSCLSSASDFGVFFFFSTICRRDR